MSVYSISQGCLVVGQYLYKYSELEQTDKVIFDTPVLGGSTFVADLLTPGRTNLNFPVILSLVSDVLHIELDLTGLSSILETEKDAFSLICSNASCGIWPDLAYASHTASSTLKK